MSVVSNIARDVKLPKMIKVKQSFSRDKIKLDDIQMEIFKQLEMDKIRSKIMPNHRIAITCGSRGISNIDLITKSIVEFVKSKGAKPFVVPSMGSHGGATAEGQKQVIEGYGVTEEYIGCPIISSMEVKKIGMNEENMDVFIDKNAVEADGIIVAGRIKPHTAFRGNYESGIMKMMAIGLGKQEGAQACHAAGFKNMAKYVPMFGRAILENAPVICGLAMLENPYDESRRFVALTPDEIITEEPKLLDEARENMPKIYFNNLAVLIVDKIGKNFSGAGMDPNITGSFGTPYASGGIKAERVIALDLSEESSGNATGIGNAHATTKRLFDKVDWESTYLNVIISTVLNVAKIPMVLKTDREAIQIALETTSESDKDNPRIVRIKNSLDIDEIYISEALLDEARENSNITIIGELMDFSFDEYGMLF